MTGKISDRELIRGTLVIVLIGALVASCLWIMRPFLLALIWAATTTIATWPLLLAVQARVRGRGRAVAVMMVLLVLIFVIPCTLAIGTIVQNAPQLSALGKQATTMEIPPPPDWVGSVPLIGHQVADAWQRAADDPADIAGRLTPYLRSIAGWLVARAGGFGLFLVHFVLTMFLTALLYANGEPAAEMMLGLARRIADKRGENAALLAARSVRAVAQGVVITALVQSLLAGLGLAMIGAPYASLLTALIFILTIAQIGPGPVLIPAIGWLFWSDSYVWGTAMLIWSALVMGMDAFLRPYLIRRNANLPLPLIFAGVIGGLLAFGVIGLFVGPVLLAVGYTLLTAWITEEQDGGQAQG